MFPPLQLTGTKAQPSIRTYGSQTERIINNRSIGDATNVTGAISHRPVRLLPQVGVVAGGKSRTMKINNTERDEKEHQHHHANEHAAPTKSKMQSNRRTKRTPKESNQPKDSPNNNVTLTSRGREEANSNTNSSNSKPSSATQPLPSSSTDETHVSMETEPSTAGAAIASPNTPRHLRDSTNETDWKSPCSSRGSTRGSARSHHSGQASSSPIPGSPGPAHVRRVSASMSAILESPRLRAATKLAPSPSRPTTTTTQRKSSATPSKPSSRQTGIRPELAQLHQQQSSSSSFSSIAANDPTDPSLPSVKPCSVLMCSLPRVHGEGYCQIHISDHRAGVKLAHKRSGSILQRILNPTASRSIHAGGYGATRHVVQGHEMHANGIGSKHGLADISPLDLIGITEGNEPTHESKQSQPHHHHHHSLLKRGNSTLEREKIEKMATGGSHYGQQSTSVSTKPTPILKDALAAEHKQHQVNHQSPISPKSSLSSSATANSTTAPMGNTLAPLRPSNSHVRRFSASKPTSTSSDWLHSPSAQAARLLRMKQKMPRRSNAPNDTHARQMSYGLPIEPLPAVDMSLAQLPFERCYFNVPYTFDDFIQYRDRVSGTPEGATVCFIIALLVWSQGKEAQESDELARLGLSVDDRAPDDDDQLPLHVINTTVGGAATKSFAVGARSVDEKDDAPSMPRVTHAHERRMKRPTDPSTLASHTPSKPSQPHTPSIAHWSMTQRWQALIACIHTDQSIEATTSNQGEAAVAFRVSQATYGTKDDKRANA